jgi:hypothetical protein
MEDKFWLSPEEEGFALLSSLKGWVLDFIRYQRYPPGGHATKMLKAQEVLLVA